MAYVKWQALNTCDFGLLHVSVRKIEQPQGISLDYSRRSRGSSGILLVTSGCLSFTQEGVPPLIAEENALCLLPQNASYRLQFLGKINTLVLINFNLISAQGEYIYPGNQLELLSPKVTNPQVLRIFDAISSYPPQNPLRYKELLYRLLALLLEDNDIERTSAGKYANLIPGVRLLRQTFLEDIPIGEFAQACNISASSFRSLFTQFYGIPPLRYRNQLRIRYAMQLLAESRCNIMEAAEASGFHNLGYFCRLYKKATGETPGQTRSRYVD